MVEYIIPCKNSERDVEMRREILKEVNRLAAGSKYYYTLRSDGTSLYCLYCKHL